jgi:methyltransferase (TIGR00027 family)
MVEAAQDTKQSSIDRKASQTAMFAAIYRHIATMEKNTSFRGPDGLAQLFLPSHLRFLLRFSFAKRSIINKVPGIYEYVIARTKFFDDLFLKALEDRIPQIVFLGAGYDTRAIRFNEFNLQTKIFELDSPYLQKKKKAIIKNNNLSIPDQLNFVPINFNNEDLETVLSKAGFDKFKQTFFIWEGVTQYLPEQTIKDTLEFIKNNSGPGSTVAFDYFYKSFVDGNLDFYGAKELYKSVNKVGEPFKFGIDEGGIDSFLDGNGFDVLANYTPDEFEKAYLYDDKGSFKGKMNDYVCHVHARVQS